MRRDLGIFLAAVLSLGLLGGALEAEECARSIGPGTGILVTDGTRDVPCGYGNLSINGDQQYENGYEFSHDCVQPPYYGAFAECFAAPENWEVCAGVYDLTVAYDCPDHHYLLDAYVWDDAGGVPGNVLAVTTGFDPYPIGHWPFITRHTVPLVAPVSGSFWIGEWGNWPGEAGTCVWFIAVDENGENQGCPMANIAPEPCPWRPGGWQSVDVVFGEGRTKALGIGYYGHSSAPTSGTPESGSRGQLSTWGTVKALYR